MKTKIASLIFAILAGVFSFSPLFYVSTAHADVSCSGTVNGVPLQQTAGGLCLPAAGAAAQTPNTLLIKIINILLGVAAGVAILFLIWGGFQYITSAGNEERAKAAQGTIVNALIGLAIIVLSFAIVTLVNQAASGLSK